MKSFNELVKAFYDWQEENDIVNNHEELIKYIWILPRDAVQQWKTELEKNKDLFREDIYQGYISQFDEGKTLLGISNIIHDDSDTVKLYRLTEYDEEFIIDNILVSKTQTLPIKGTEIELPGGQTFELPITIKYGSITLNEPYDLKDSKVNQNHGVLVGDGFRKGLRESNMIGSNSLMATVNYKTGEFAIIRNNDENEINFVKNAKPSTSSSSSSSGSSSSSTSTKYHYTYLTISGNFTTLGTPVELAFSFDCTGDSNSTVDNKAVINGILLKQNEFIKQYINNYDYDLGIRTDSE